MELMCNGIVGSMCFMSGSVEMENIFIPENEVGMWQWLFGKTVTSIVLRNAGPSDGFVGIAAPSLARILPVSAPKTLCCSQPFDNNFFDMDYQFDINQAYSFCFVD